MLLKALLERFQFLQIVCISRSGLQPRFRLIRKTLLTHIRGDGLMVHDLVLVQVKKPEESKYPWDYYQILAHIPGEQAFGAPDPACPLVKQ